MTDDWPEELPILSQELLEEFPYRYSNISSSYPGVWGILRKLFPNHTTEAIATYISIFAHRPFLSRSIGRASMINLTICLLGYTEGQDTQTLTYYKEIIDGKNSRTHRIGTTQTIRTIRPNRPRPLQDNKTSNLSKDDAKVLRPTLHTSTRHTARRS
jgi:hypothetical protein